MLRSPMILLVGAAAALQQPSVGSRAAISRRAVCTGVFAAAAAGMTPQAARANFVDAEGMLRMLKEFPDFGMSTVDAPPGSMPFADMLSGIKEKKVEGVVFFPPFGDEAYALVEGKSIRIGKGWPVEVNDTPQTPRIVIPVLDTEGIPYAWNFDLKKRESKYAKR